MSKTNSNRIIEVRKAELDDYQAVLDINTNIYGGLDYIPNQYHNLISDPDFTFYVGLVNGEVAAFQGICLLDDNKTFLMRSNRVKEKFKGQGILSHVRRRIYEDFKDFPGKKRFRSATVGDSIYTNSKTFLSQNRILKIEKITRMDVKKMYSVPACDDETKSITWEQFDHLIQIDALKHYLYPENIITANFCLFDVLTSNIRHLKKQSSKIFISKELYKFLPTERADKAVECNKGDSPISQGLLTIVTHYFTQTYLCFVMNISGLPTEGKEVEEITPLLKQSLAYLRTLYLDGSRHQKAVLTFVRSPLVPDEIFYEAGKPFGLLPTSWELQLKNTHYFEQDFETFSKA